MIASMDDLVAGLAAGDRCPVQKNSIVCTILTHHSIWRAAGQPAAGAVPPTGVGEAPTKATAGALSGWSNAGVGEDTYLAQASMVAEDVGVWVLYDRLVHTSGLSGTSVVSQTVNTAALTRYTDGVGVEAWVEIYTPIGATPRTLTMTYTNSEGTSGRTGTLLTTANPVAGRMYQFSLQAGDTGVRSVESVILSGTSGTVGDFGITLVKRIAELSSVVSPVYASKDAFDLGLPTIEDNACLTFIAFVTASPAGPMMGLFTIAKG